MWLLPAFSALANAAARAYYRLTIAGASVPPAGPVLLVANHPNGLIDPILVCATARRPVRFLAKEPLFRDARTGWLMRAVGAIPVYRPKDDPALVGRNVEAFAAVFRALAGGAAVGIFPEGASHNEPSLLELRTGAARIALGAAGAEPRAFPVIPIGLVFRKKDEFRSRAHVIVGGPVPWDDLAGRGAQDAAAVRELTDRIGDALREVTINLERWADGPLVECAQRIWEAEHGADRAPAARVARLAVTTGVLADLRREADPRRSELIRDVDRHCRRLARLRISPAALQADTGLGTGLRWTVRHFHLLLPPAVLLAAGGWALFWLPYRATGMVIDRLDLTEDQRSTWKLLVGIGLHGVWSLLLAAAAGAAWGWPAAVVSVAVVPAVGIAGLAVRERWRGAWGDARRFLLLRSRTELVADLRARQRDLAGRLRALRDARPPADTRRDASRG
jgi:1-acyl-sn-glycerol-3-phosphate acyltransferase